MTEQRTDEGVTRRRALRLCGAGLASGLAGLAGCTSLPPLGSEVRYGAVDVPAADEAGYRAWLPAPSAFPAEADVGSGYHVLTYAGPGRDAPDWQQSSIARSLVVYYSDYVGVHVDDVDLAIAGDDFTIFQGDVEPATVADALADTSYEREGALGEFDLWTRPDLPRFLAVRAGRLVFAGGAAARGRLETVLDARRGAVPRYHEENTNAATLIDAAGHRHWSWLRPGTNMHLAEPDVREERTAWGVAFDHDDRGVYILETWLFPDDADVTEAAVKEALTNRGRAVDANAVDVDVEDSVARIAMFLRHERYQDEHADGTLVAPFVTWSGSYDADAERLTVRHEAGDPVETAYLTAYPDGADPVESFDGVGDRFEPGEAMTVAVPASASDIRFMYADPAGDSSTTIFDYELP